MITIVSYRKYIDPQITREIKLPVDSSNHSLGTELATVDGLTYVSIPDGAVLPTDQPKEISASISVVTLTPALVVTISNASPHVRLIRQRVQEKITEHYSLTDEIKLLRTAPSPEHELYNAYAEDCRAWGRAQKAALGLV